MPQLVRLANLAQKHLSGFGAERSVRLCLSLVLKPLVGIERIFHFETARDVGLALLTGGRRVLSRSTLGSWVRQVPESAMQLLMRATEPVMSGLHKVLVSIDEHAVPRFTHKFTLPKGFHTIRSKYMPVEKLFFPFLVGTGHLLTLRARIGTEKLLNVVQELWTTLRRRAHGRPMIVLLDAGAAESPKELVKFARTAKATLLVRAPRHEVYQRQWEQIPFGAWKPMEEEGPYVGAPRKPVWLADTMTRVREELEDGSEVFHEVRTVTVREQGRTGKERWHAIWVFNDDTTKPWSIVELYRCRQGHEQRYRILLRDAYVDTAPSGYAKDSPDPANPGFRPNALGLYSWLAGWTTNVLEEFSRTLPARFLHAHLRTLRRWWLLVPASLYQGPDTLLVVVEPNKHMQQWAELADELTRRRLRVPWLRNRRLVMTVELPKRHGRAEISYPAAKRTESVRC